MTKFEAVLLSIEGQIARVTMSRPDVRNAFHPTMIRELTEIFRSISKNEQVRVVVLNGAGKSFCSGADLGYMKSMADFTLEENRQDSDRLFEMFWELRNCPHPVVGRVHGHAMGGALGLAAVCDVVGAVEGTQFCFSEVKLGLAPAVISPFVLERMAVSQARRYMLTGEVFSTREAYESGLVHYVGDEAAVDGFVAGVVKALLENGPEAVRATKSLAREVRETSSWVDRRAATTRVIAERRVSAEGQEGLRGFLEKRTPSWKVTT